MANEIIINPEKRDPSYILNKGDIGLSKVDNYSRSDYKALMRTTIGEYNSHSLSGGSSFRINGPNSLGEQLVRRIITRSDAKEGSESEQLVIGQFSGNSGYLKLGLAFCTGESNEANSKDHYGMSQLDPNRDMYECSAILDLYISSEKNGETRKAILKKFDIEILGNTDIIEDLSVYITEGSESEELELTQLEKDNGATSRCRSRARNYITVSGLPEEVKFITVSFIQSFGYIFPVSPTDEVFNDIASASVNIIDRPLNTYNENQIRAEIKLNNYIDRN